MESRLTFVLNGMAPCMAPSSLKKALLFRAIELASQGRRERDGEVVGSASQGSSATATPSETRF